MNRYKKSVKSKSKKLKDYKFDYLLDDNVSNLKEFAEKHKLNYESLSQCASKNKWKEAKEKNNNKINDLALRKTTEKKSDKLSSARDMALELGYAVVGINNELAKRISDSAIKMLEAMESDKPDEVEQYKKRISSLISIQKAIPYTLRDADMLLNKMLSLEGESSATVTIKAESLPGMTDEALKQLALSFKK